MDSYEATKLLFSRIKAIDPENASKIMGYLLIQDNGHEEMIRLAFGPETFLHNLIFKAKTHLSNASASANSAATPFSLSPCSAPWLPASSSTNSSLSYASVVVNGTSAAAAASGSEYYSNISNFDEFHNQLQVQDHLSLLDESQPAMSTTNADHDTNYGLGCLYFTKGFCINGTTCKFHHIQSPDSAAAIVGPPSKLNEFERFQPELLLRSKAAVLQQRKLAAASQFINFLNIDTQRSAALMTSDFSMISPSARQIYLTFPADSTFTEKDISNYFSIYGPVHDVRIPYQQKRMFGFVTFVYPEAVKLILAKGNPHFVCDSRVLVKPYKEKGKFQEKKMEREEYPSACSSPSGPFDFHFGGRMLYNNRDLLRRKLEEQADLQQALELQGRRLMNLKLHLKNNHHNHQFHHGLSNGSPIPSPTLSHTPNNQTRIFSPEGTNEEVPPEENGGNSVTDSKNVDNQLQQEGNPGRNHNDNNNNYGDNKEEKTNIEENDLQDSFEHILPDNLFASPKKSAGGHITVFSSASAETNEKNTSSVVSNNNYTKLPSTSPLYMAPFNSSFKCPGSHLGMKQLACSDQK